MKRFFVLILLFVTFLTLSCQNKSAVSLLKSDNPPTVEYRTLDAPIAESKITKLIKGFDKNDHFGASGIYSNGNYFYITFDNTHEIAKVLNTLPSNSKMNQLIGKKQGKSNYEGITFDPSSNHWYVLEESQPKDSLYSPRINQFDQSFVLENVNWSNSIFTEVNANKAFEGVAFVNRNSINYLLGLVEGTGTIVVMQLIGETWVGVSEFNIPVKFRDYSDITIFYDRIAVTSQEDAKLYIGLLSPSAWKTVGNSIVYNFPKGDKNGIVGSGNLLIYANVEGVSFINDNTIVTCTDRANEHQPKFHKHKDQSIQIFKLN